MSIPYYIGTIILLNFAIADYAGSANSVISAANQLSDKLSSWNSGAGLQGALGVQSDFPALSSALGGLSSVVVNAKVSDIDVAVTSSVDSAVAALLSELSQKASDFNAIGAGSIATDDLKNVAGPSADIINGLVRVLGSDSAKWNSLSDGLLALESSLNAANKAYNVPEVSFAATPTFSGSSSSSPSLGSSMFSSSASDSSASSSSSRSLSTSNPGSGSGIIAASTHGNSTFKTIADSTARGATAVGSKNGTVSATHSKTPNIHNGVSRVGLGLGAGAAGVAALLL